jgi:DNA-binding IclR family transcriptional regulator
MHAADDSIVKSASRALRIVDYLANCPKPQTFTELQAALGIPKSSLSYLLQELQQGSYVEFDQETKSYFAGTKLIQLGAACLNNTNTSREIWRAIKKLGDTLGETTQAALLDGRMAVYFAKHIGVRDLSITDIGFRIPAHATALGKVLLSSLNRTELEDRLAGVPLERYTEHTITDFGRLCVELEKAVRNGYAVDDQEIIPGAICVAAPVHTKASRSVAAISVTFPAIRLKETPIETIVDQVKAAALNASARLGHTSESRQPVTGGNIHA